MILLFILLGLTVLGIYLLYKSYKYELIGFILFVTFGLFFLIHCFQFFTQDYYYGLFVAERNSFEITLKQSRELDNKYETATIVKEVAKWNTKLAEYKYDNRNWFLGQYIDDRIELLKPIK